MESIGKAVLDGAEATAIAFKTWRMVKKATDMSIPIVDGGCTCQKSRSYSTPSCSTPWNFPGEYIMNYVLQSELLTHRENQYRNLPIMIALFAIQARIDIGFFVEI